MAEHRRRESLPVWLIGRRYWKVGDHGCIWVVDAVEPGKAGQPAYVILVTDDERSSEDVELSHLENPELYTPVAPKPA